MTYLWSGMILIGVIYGTVTGNLQAVTEAAVSSSKEAVTLCISMAGVTAMWTGLMKIAEMTGLVAQLAKQMRPVMRFLFPGLKVESEACKYISLNFLSNCLGLGWAATPAGLKAIEELEALEEERRMNEEESENIRDSAGSRNNAKPEKVTWDKRRKRGMETKNNGINRRRKSAVPRGTASNEMCTFLIINVSSLQLIPVNIIAYRSQYGSVNPAFIVGPAILATLVSTAVGILFCKMMDRGRSEE